MPISTFLGLETTLRGILAQQQALDTTGHNIANSNTVGYTRQEAVLQATPAFTPAVGPGQIGTGVDVATYQRARDDYIDIQVRAQTMRQSYSQATSDGLSQVETALNEPSNSGLQSLLGNYWASWQNVVNSPQDVPTREALAQSAASLADGFNTLSSQLSTITSQTAQSVTDTVSQVNTLGTQIAQLTQSITQAEQVGVQPNDLLDQRDNLLDQLSGIANISVTQGSLGSVTVSIGGATFVNGSTANTLSESGGVFTMTAAGPPVTTSTASVTSGKLAGLVTLRDTTLPGYQSTLDGIASALITKTNTQHALGFDLSGAAGGQFFTGASASTIAVAPGILANPSTIAASAVTGQAGNSANALAIADLQSTAAVGSATIDDAYSAFVTKVGADSAAAKQTLSNATALAQTMENQRQSVSGVSINEEMARLLQYQRGFQASARALTAMDDMISQLISNTGKVGL